MVLNLTSPPPSLSVAVTFGGAVELILSPPPPIVRCIVATAYSGSRFVVKAEGFHMAYNLPDDHEVVVQVSYVDAHGHPATIDGTVAWATSDPTIVNVTPDAADSTEATVSPATAGGGKLGTAQVTATADADLGTGVRNLLTTFDVTIVAGEAVAGTISPVGDATPINPPAAQTVTGGTA